MTTLATVVDMDRVHHTNVRGIGTRYYDAGGGHRAPLLLLHGGHFGSTMPVAFETFSENLASLAADRRVVALDRLGQGGTDAPNTDEEWTFDKVVEHAIDFVRQIELSDFIAIGHSRGGLVATALALALPTSVSALVIVASATTAPEDPGSPSESFYEEFVKTAPWGEGGPAVADAYRKAQAGDVEWSKEYIELLGQRMDSEEHQRRVARLRANSQTWKESLEEGRKAVLSAIADGQLTQPLHIVWGADDRSSPLHLAFDLARRFAGGGQCVSLHVIPNAGHHVFRDNSTAFNRVIASL